MGKKVITKIYISTENKISNLSLKKNSYRKLKSTK